MNITLSGDVGTELTDLVLRNLKNIYPELCVDCSAESEEAHAIAFHDVLATAAAIAGVLNFFLNARKAQMERKAKADANSKADEYLRSFSADGFETESVEFVEEASGAKSVGKVVIRDVADQLTLEISQESDNRFFVRRRITQSRLRRR